MTRIGAMRNAPLLRNLASLAQGESKPPRVRAQLEKLGWFKDLEITPAGREALRAGAVEAEARSSSALGDANACREKCRFDAAERHLERSQHYLDLANVLRGNV